MFSRTIHTILRRNLSSQRQKPMTEKVQLYDRVVPAVLFTAFFAVAIERMLTDPDKVRLSDGLAQVFRFIGRQTNYFNWKENKK